MIWVWSKSSCKIEVSGFYLPLARGPISRSQAPANEFAKQQQSQPSLGVSTTDPEASLPGSISGEGSCQSSATQNSANNSTTASNGGDRRISTGEMQQSQASPSLEDISGQRYESNYGGRYSEDNDPELSKLKFRRRIMGMSDKSGAVRRYHRRLGVGVCGRVSASSGSKPEKSKINSKYTYFDILRYNKHQNAPLTLIAVLTPKAINSSQS